MSQGFLVRTSSGKLIDSTTIPVTLLDLIVVPAGGGGVKSYPELANRGVTLGVAVQKTVNTTFRNIEATTSVINGVPTVSWAPSGSSGSASGALVIVFVR
jgi:hypothetical protein